MWSQQITRHISAKSIRGHPTKQYFENIGFFLTTMTKYIARFDEKTHWFAKEIKSLKQYIANFMYTNI